MNNSTKTSAASAPLVSMVMSVYNGEKYLRAAVNSVLDQDFEDFELILINDGSKDRSPELINQLAAQDKRIVAIHQENQGLVAALNNGIAKARGTYIARADCDDYCMPGRFRKQVAILEKNPDVVLATGSIEIIDEDDVFIARVIVPLEDEDIKRRMYIENPIAHGSTMFRRDAVLKVGGYSTEAGPAEDFHLWKRLANEGRFVAIDGYAYRWRVNPDGITSNNNKVQLQHMDAMINDLWATKPPTVRKRAELRSRGKEYVELEGVDGVAMKLDMLADNSRLAVKMLTRGHAVEAFRQLIAVFLVGRSGAKTVIRRIHLIINGRYHHVRQEKNDAS